MLELPASDRCACPRVHGQDDGPGRPRETRQHTASVARASRCCSRDESSRGDTCRSRPGPGAERLEHVAERVPVTCTVRGRLRRGAVSPARAVGANRTSDSLSVSIRFRSSGIPTRYDRSPPRREAAGHPSPCRPRPGERRVRIASHDHPHRPLASRSARASRSFPIASCSASGREPIPRLKCGVGRSTARIWACDIPWS